MIRAYITDRRWSFIDTDGRSIWLTYDFEKWCEAHLSAVPRLDSRFSPSAYWLDFKTAEDLSVFETAYPES